MGFVRGEIQDHFSQHPLGSQNVLLENSVVTCYKQLCMVYTKLFLRWKNFPLLVLCQFLKYIEIVISLMLSATFEHADNHAVFIIWAICASYTCKK